jgi:hypothetical protein
VNDPVHFTSLTFFESVPWAGVAAWAVLEATVQIKATASRKTRADFTGSPLPAAGHSVQQASIGAPARDAGTLC